MIKKIFSFAPLDPFKRPFDFNTPFSRRDFWLFYLCYILFSSLSLGVSEVMLQVINPEDHTGIVVGLFLIIPSLIWLLYLITTLLSATARRMRDSGYYRIGLVLSCSLSIATFSSMFWDVFKSFDNGIFTKNTTTAHLYSEHTIWLAIAAIASLIYVFLGTIRKRKAEKNPK